MLCSYHPDPALCCTPELGSRWWLTFRHTAVGCAVVADIVAVADIVVAVPGDCAAAFVVGAAAGADCAVDRHRPKFQKLLKSIRKKKY